MLHTRADSCLFVSLFIHFDVNFLISFADHQWSSCQTTEICTSSEHLFHSKLKKKEFPYVFGHLLNVFRVKTVWNMLKNTAHILGSKYSRLGMFLGVVTRYPTLTQPINKKKGWLRQYQLMNDLRKINCSCSSIILHNNLNRSTIEDVTWSSCDIDIFIWGIWTYCTTTNTANYPPSRSAQMNF